MLNVAPVLTKYWSFVISLVKNIKPELGGKSISVAVACIGVAAAELEGAWRPVFQIGARVHTHSGSCPIEILVLTHAIAGFFNL